MWWLFQWWAGSQIIAISEVESTVCYLQHVFSWTNQYPSAKRTSFWESMKALQIFMSSSLEPVNHIECNSTFNHCVCLIVVFQMSMLAWKEKLTLKKTWFHLSLLDDVSIDTPTSQWWKTSFPSNNIGVARPFSSFYVLSQYLPQPVKVEFPITHKNDRIIQELQKFCYSDRKIHQHQIRQFSAVLFLCKNFQFYIQDASSEKKP